jgi:hypothetical protein
MVRGSSKKEEEGYGEKKGSQGGERANEFERLREACAWPAKVRRDIGL